MATVAKSNPITYLEHQIRSIDKTLDVVGIQSYSMSLLGTVKTNTTSPIVPRKDRLPPLNSTGILGDLT